MSLSSLGLTSLVLQAVGLLSPVLFIPRSIGGFVADVTVEEDHVDELEITNFPVEQGASITDHSFKLPAQVRILAGYSNSSLAAFGDPNYIRAVYDSFLTLQASREPFDIFTGKRIYQNMLIRRLHTMSNQQHENDLMLDIECREIQITYTQTVTVPPTSSMKDPSSTGPAVGTGAKSLQSGGNFNPAAAVANGIAPL